MEVSVKRLPEGTLGSICVGFSPSCVSGQEPANKMMYGAVCVKGATCSGDGSYRFKGKSPDPKTVLGMVLVGIDAAVVVVLTATDLDAIRSNAGNMSLTLSAEHVQLLLDGHPHTIRRRKWTRKGYVSHTVTVAHVSFDRILSVIHDVFSSGLVPLQPHTSLSVPSSPLAAVSHSTWESFFARVLEPMGFSVEYPDVHGSQTDVLLVLPSESSAGEGSPLRVQIKVFHKARTLSILKRRRERAKESRAGRKLWFSQYSSVRRFADPQLSVHLGRGKNKLFDAGSIDLFCLLPPPDCLPLVFLIPVSEALERGLVNDQEEDRLDDREASICFLQSCLPFVYPQLSSLDSSGHASGQLETGGGDGIGHEIDKRRMRRGKREKGGPSSPSNNPTLSIPLSGSVSDTLPRHAWIWKYAHHCHQHPPSSTPSIP